MSSCLNNIEIDFMNVFNEINSINTNSSMGPDGLFAFFLKKMRIYCINASFVFYLIIH